MEQADGELEQIWPELQRIAAPARERRRLGPAIFADLVMSLCSVAPLSVRELSLLLERSEAYVGDAIRPLVSADRIRFLYPDQPKHPRQKYITSPSAAVIAPSAPPATATPRAAATPPVAATPPATATPPAAASSPAPPPPSQITPTLSRDAEEMIARASARRLEAARQLEMAATRAESNQSVADLANNGWGSPAVSIVAAMVIGVALALLARSHWVYYGIGASAIFAILHIVSRSSQYQQYLARGNARAAGPSASDATVFFLAKAAFSFVEIALAVMLVSFLRQLVS